MNARRNATAAVALPPYWAQALQALRSADAVMGGLIDRYRGEVLRSRGEPFQTLARSIVGQQISVKAADSVWMRVCAALPEISPAAVLAKTVDELRACGLSARKVEYLHDLAARFADGRLHAQHWPQYEDAAVIAELTAVRGIGVWTAEMFLIFNLLRPDVYPLDDIGLQKAVALHYCQGERPDRGRLTQIGEAWRPWRSVATWYLWRSLDPVPVAY